MTLHDCMFLILHSAQICLGMWGRLHVLCNSGSASVTASIASPKF